MQPFVPDAAPATVSRHHQPVPLGRTTRTTKLAPRASGTCTKRLLAAAPRDTARRSVRWQPLVQAIDALAPAGIEESLSLVHSSLPPTRVVACASCGSAAAVGVGVWV